MARFAVGRRALAICDRCGFQIRYRDLRAEFDGGRPTGVKVCRSCWDPYVEEDPPTVIEGIELRDPRPDTKEREASRRLIGKVDFQSYPFGPILSRDLACTLGQLSLVATVSGRMEQYRAQLSGELGAGAFVEADLDIFPISMVAELAGTGQVLASLTGESAALEASLGVSGGVGGGVLTGSSAALGASLGVSGGIDAVLEIRNQLSAELVGTSSMGAGTLTVANELYATLTGTGGVSGALRGSLAELGAQLEVSGAVGAEITVPDVVLDWTAFFDYTSAAYFYEDASGVTPAEDPGDRVARVVDPVSGAMTTSAVGGDGVRFHLSTAVAPRTLYTDGWKWHGDTGWLDGALNGTDPWWGVLAMYVPVKSGQGWLLEKTHVASPLSNIQLNLYLDDEVAELELVRTVEDTETKVVLPIPDITDGPIVVSFGYDGTDISLRLGLGTPVAQAASGSLPSSSETGYVTFGGAGAVIHYYAFGFMDSFPIGGGQTQAIERAADLAGISL